MQFMFYCLKPIAFIVFEIGNDYLTPFINTKPEINVYLWCGIIFNITFYIATIYFVKHVNIISYISDIVSISYCRSKNLMYVLLMFSLISYSFTALKFHDILYPIHQKDSFEAMMSLVHGGWFINVLSAIVIYPILLILSMRMSVKLLSSFGYLTVFIIFYYVLTAPSTRTWAVAMILTYYFYIEDKLKNKLCLFTTVSSASLVLMFVLNYFRQGLSLSNTAQMTLTESLNSLLLNFLQFENSLILIDYFDNHAWLNFKYLWGALTPLVLIPSALLPFKPAADKEAYLTDIVFGNKLNLLYYKENSTLTYSLPMSSYTDFGYVGVVVGAIIFALICSVFLKIISENKSPIRFMYINIFISMSASYRLGVEGALTSFYITIFTLFFIKILLKVRVCATSDL